MAMKLRKSLSKKICYLNKKLIDSSYMAFFFAERYLDFLNLMTYDLRGPSDEMASHHSALYSGSYEEGEQKVFNQVI